MTISQSAIDEVLAQGGGGDSPSQPIAESPAARSPSPGGSAEKTRTNTDIRRIMHLEVPLAVTLADRLMSIEMALEIRVGTIIEFDVSFDDDLTLHVGKQPIAKGQAVKVGENFGLRVTRIDTVADRIEAMGGASGP